MMGITELDIGLLCVTQHCLLWFYLFHILGIERKKSIVTHAEEKIALLFCLGTSGDSLVSLYVYIPTVGLTSMPRI